MFFILKNSGNELFFLKNSAYRNLAKIAIILGLPHISSVIS